MNGITKTLVWAALIGAAWAVVYLVAWLLWAAVGLS